MKILFFFIVLFLIINSCQNPIETDNSLNQVYLKTNKTFYSNFDNITVLIENKQTYNIQVSLKCNIYLEMFYQRKQDSTWSDNLYFRYMYARCLSSLDTIKPNKMFSYTLQDENSEITDSIGTYRFVLRYYPLIVSLADTIYSNSFEVK